LRVLVERARVVRPDFAVTPANASAVARMVGGLGETGDAVLGWCPAPVTIAKMVYQDDAVVPLAAAIRRRRPRRGSLRRPRLGAGVHACLEEPVGPASVALGPVQSEVGVLQQLVQIQPVPGGERDAARRLLAEPAEPSPPLRHGRGRRAKLQTVNIASPTTRKCEDEGTIETLSGLFIFAGRLVRFCRGIWIKWGDGTWFLVGEFVV